MACLALATDKHWDLKHKMHSNMDIKVKRKSNRYQMILSMPE